MVNLIQTLLNGALAGGVYAIAALGLSISFGMLNFFNFAHGTFIMVGLFGSYFLFSFLGIDPYLTILIVAPALFAAGFLLQVAFINRLIRREPIEVRDPASILLFTVGLSAVVLNLFIIFFTATNKHIEVSYGTASFYMGDFIIPQGRLFAFVTAVVLVSAIQLFFTKTYIGKAIRAVAENRKLARLMGVDDYWIYPVAFGLSTSICGVAAGSLLPFYYVSPNVGHDFLMNSFLIVILAGVGRVKGVLLAGVIIGELQSKALTSALRRTQRRYLRSKMGCGKKKYNLLLLSRAVPVRR